MKYVKIIAELPSKCPACGNPNANIEGSVYDTKQYFKISCMNCGNVYEKHSNEDMEITK
jgi:uncharacterized protein (DUF983 family)